MENQLQTVITPLRRQQTPARRTALLVHIYPTGPEMGTRFPLADAPLVIGRDEGCEILINDTSVSRRHATVAPSGGGYVVRDLGSTNGTFVNNAQVNERSLDDGDYVRIGTRIFRFLTGGNVEAEYHEEIYRLTILDALTEIHNKRYLLEFLDRELARALRHGRPLSLIMFDIDRFKSINDTLGHIAGDYTLRELAASLKGEVRRDELLARYGGEEFAVVLPETGLDDAVAAAERLRRRVAEHAYFFEDERYDVTISLGVAVSGGEVDSVQRLLQRADQMLYKAKNDGRNCVRAAAAEKGSSPDVVLPRAEDRSGQRRAVGQLDQFLRSLTLLAQVAAQRDGYGPGHPERLTRLAMMLADALKLGPVERSRVRLGMGLCDIGKIVVDEMILRKPGKLSEEEFWRVKEHVLEGETLLAPVAGLEPILPLIRHHHERWDGRGYPDRLAADAIPQLARVAAVADAYAAMTADRPYRKAMSVDEALEELRSGAGWQFDPECVKAFVTLRERLVAGR